MQKIKLNISGNLVGVTIPVTMSFSEVESQLREITTKNYKLLKTLKFYEFIDCNFEENENRKLEEIMETITKLSCLTNDHIEENEREEVYENRENIILPKKIKVEEKDFKVHYGILRSGEKLTCDVNLIVLGNTNPGSYIKSKKSIFVYGKAQGTIHAGSENDECQNEVVYLEECGTPKVRIGSAQRTYCNTEELKNLLFEREIEEIEIKEITSLEVNKVLEKIGIDLV